MSDCVNLTDCAFYKKYTEDEISGRTLAMLINKYCHTELQSKCLRNIVIQTLGSSESVPGNMMPNGLPLPKTDNETWTDDVKNAIHPRQWKK